jgi:hypothetical protein
MFNRTSSVCLWIVMITDSAGTLRSQEQPCTGPSAGESARTWTFDRAATGAGRLRGSGWGPYEHRPPTEWQDGQNTSEAYRRCCTSVGWVAQALALGLMRAERDWGHDAFFDYVDRWMFEDDAEFVKTIRDATGKDHDKDWARQGQAWDTFVNDMWAKHRPTFPARIDGWKQDHDDGYYRQAIEMAK